MTLLRQCTIQMINNSGKWATDAPEQDREVYSKAMAAGITDTTINDQIQFVLNVGDNQERGRRIPVAPPKADDGIEGYARAWRGLCPGHSPRCEEIWRDMLIRAADMPEGKVWLEALKRTICAGFHKHQENNDNRRYAEVVVNPKTIPCTVCLDQCPFLTIDIDMKMWVRNS